MTTLNSHQPDDTLAKAWQRECRGMSVVLFMDVETWDESDTDGDDESEIDEESAPSESFRTLESCFESINALKSGRKEVETAFWRDASFHLRHEPGQYIDRENFKIDPRIQCLTIHQEPGMDLWTGTTKFLQKHLSDGNRMRELEITGEGFEDDPNEPSLARFLKTVSNRVEQLTFCIDVVTESDFRPCKVQILRDGKITVRAAFRRDFLSIQKLLNNAGGLRIERKIMKWVRAAAQT